MEKIDGAELFNLEVVFGIDVYNFLEYLSNDENFELLENFELEEILDKCINRYNKVSKYLFFNDFSLISTSGDPIKGGMQTALVTIMRILNNRIEYIIKSSKINKFETDIRRHKTIIKQNLNENYIKDDKYKKKMKIYEGMNR